MKWVSPLRPLPPRLDFNKPHPGEDGDCFISRDVYEHLMHMDRTGRGVEEEAVRQTKTNFRPALGPNRTSRHTELSHVSRRP